MTSDPSSPAAAEPPAAGRPGESLALYRRYRPATFAEVKGQDQVTQPLIRALETGRISHAYLFSGPRGCGKTTSARILARSLNCVNGPTPQPCGKCESCVALAPNGPGSIDVIEIDAASHGGVDDARDLRERAFYAPVSGRFKIYIIDEAHMVTREGFNALLKLVEEPPAHLKFVFATTEPEKVIPTIRSRTHHYPFRLVPPAVLRELLADILDKEGVSWEPEVLPLVIRAGAGSVRDSLSVLDQLLAGTDEAGLTYEKTAFLLGYTDVALLDEVTDAFAAGDGAAIFQAVDRVMEAGLDPRRFAADLLDRLRDLIVLTAVPDAGRTGLIDAPADRLERMREQAARFGQAGLTRAAEVISDGLVQMRGATAPRLLLELMCARVLLPGGDAGQNALLARLERLERSVASGSTQAAAGPSARSASGPSARSASGSSTSPASGPSAGSASGSSTLPASGPSTSPASRPDPGPSTTPAPHPASGSAVPPGPSQEAGDPGGQAARHPTPRIPPQAGKSAPRKDARDSAAIGEVTAPRGTGVPSATAVTPGTSTPPGASTAPTPRTASTAPAASTPRTASTAPAASTPRAASTAAPVDAESLRRDWPRVLDAVKRERRVAWMLLSNATVQSLQDGVLTVRFAQEGQMKGFVSSGRDTDLSRVLARDFGLNVQVKATSPASSASVREPTVRSGVREPTVRSGVLDPTPSRSEDVYRSTPPETSQDRPASAVADQPEPAAPPAPAPAPAPAREDDRFDAEDPESSVAEPRLTGMDLIRRELGGEIIDEIENG